MTNRMTFYVVTFTSSEGTSEMSRTYTTIRMARKLAAHIAKFATNVRIMKGGQGGMQVS